MEDYCCYDIQKNNIYGRYAVSSKDLEPGDLIATELPYVYGPKSDSPPVCLGCLCGVNGETLCSVCGWPVCNNMCEKLPSHSNNECSIFSKAKIKFTPVKDLTQSCPQYECIMPLRVLLVKETDEEKWNNEIKLLESHCEARKNTEVWKIEEINVIGFLHKVCKLEKRFPADLIHLVCGILEVNAFTAPAAFGFEMRCIYPKSSLISHSCVPNVGHYIFSESRQSRIYVRAMVKIKKGEELFLTYTQTLSPTYFRRIHLKEGKFFDCACQRCADPTELGTNLSTLRCVKCVNGLVTSTNPLDQTAQWKCEKCKCVTEYTEIEKLLRCVQNEADELHNCPNPVTSRESFIEKQSRVLHPNHAIIMSVKSSLSQLYGSMGCYHITDLSDTILQRKIDLCYEIDEISNKIKPGISRQRGWNLFQLYSPIVLLAKSNFSQNKIDKTTFTIQLQKAATYLEEVVHIFSYEDPGSPEGFAAKKAAQILQHLRISIETLPQ